MWLRCKTSHSSDETLHQNQLGRKKHESSFQHVSLCVSTSECKMLTNKTRGMSLGGFRVPSGWLLWSCYPPPPYSSSSSSSSVNPANLPQPPRLTTPRQVLKRSTFDLSAECLAMIISLPLTHSVYSRPSTAGFCLGASRWWWQSQTGPASTPLVKRRLAYTLVHAKNCIVGGAVVHVSTWSHSKKMYIRRGGSERVNIFHCNGLNDYSQMMWGIYHRICRRNEGCNE